MKTKFSKTKLYKVLALSLIHIWLILEEGLSGRTTCFDDPIHEALSGLEQICLLYTSRCV